MASVHTTTRLTAQEQSEVLGFLDHAHTLDCVRLNDHLHLDLARGPRPGFLAALARDTSGTLIGYAQASTANDGHVVDAIVSSQHPAEPDDTRLQLLRSVVGDLPPGRSITWWADPEDGAAGVAAQLGMHPHRRLELMERSLPLLGCDDPVLATRPFVPGVDDEEWLLVNNAAFAGHGEQGGWDRATLDQRLQEPWFDPRGFLLHHIDDRLAGFCWTKIHAEVDNGRSHLVGEIYVIAVHPDFHGAGLGRALTIAGLRHMEAVGADGALLYVDSENHHAVRLYLTLGFRVSHHHQSYRRETRGSR